MTGIPRFEADEQELRNEHGEPGTNIVTVSGLTGTGTSTLAGFLADEFDMERFDAGQFFREQAAKRGMDIQEFDDKQPEIEEEEDIDFDLEWDCTALRYAFTKDKFVLEGRLAGALLHGIAPVRVWVECDPVTVAERLTSHEDDGSRAADRDGMTVAEATAYVKERNENVMQRYKDKYDIDPTKEEFYNVFIDNSQPLDVVKQEIAAKVRDVLGRETER